MLSHWLVEQRLARRLDKIERRMDRTEYWRVYADVLNDLSGIDGETSGDISTERAPRR
jgi:IS1 family transposase